MSLDFKIDYLLKKPSLAQFAVDGIWEEAFSFMQGKEPNDEILEKKFLDKDDLAFEAFFDNSFFGLRNNSKYTSLEFSKICTKNFSICSNGYELLKNLAVDLESEPFFNKLEFLELGAVNAWRSVGSVKFELNNLANSWHQLLKAPVFKDEKHLKVIELAYNGTFKHWYALPVSKKDPPYDIDRELFDSVLGKLIN